MRLADPRLQSSLDAFHSVTLAELIAHIGTWSAVQRSREAGSDPLPNLQAELESLWPEMGQAALLVRWPFMGRWGQL